MTTPPIVESGMTFGPYPDGHCFNIEKCRAYQKIQDGVKIAEFLLLRVVNGNVPSVWVVEAKSGTPAPADNITFDKFIEEIKEKLINALSLGIAFRLNRHLDAAGEFPQPFRNIDLSVSQFHLVLVVNGHKKAWLPPLQEALSRALNPTVKTWALSPTAVIVINDDLARTRGLIS